MSSSGAVNNLDDYCRLFECRSQLYVELCDMLFLFSFFLFHFFVLMNSSIKRLFRLLKSIAQRLSKSMLSTYDVFMKNSIELVHIAKVDR
jgi:hypothetical protein